MKECGYFGVGIKSGGFSEVDMCPSCAITSRIHALTMGDSSCKLHSQWSEKTIHRMGNFFPNHISDEWLVSRMYKRLLQLKLNIYKWFEKTFL